MQDKNIIHVKIRFAVGFHLLCNRNWPLPTVHTYVCIRYYAVVAAATAAAVIFQHSGLSLAS